jgi:hypothetical protein
MGGECCVNNPVKVVHIDKSLPDLCERHSCPMRTQLTGTEGRVLRSKNEEMTMTNHGMLTNWRHRPGRRFSGRTMPFLLTEVSRTKIWSGQKSVSSVFSLNFQAFSFILHLLMKTFPFVLYHSLKPVDPCFEDNHEDSLSDFVENVGNCAF